MGIDVSDIAIKMANKNRPGISFSHIEADAFIPKISYDVVIFNEVLYYTNHKEIIRKFTKYLAPEGIIIISCWFNDKINGIMHDIFGAADELLAPIDEVIISGHKVPKNIKRRIPVSFRIGAYRNR